MSEEMEGESKLLRYKRHSAPTQSSSPIALLGVHRRHSHIPPSPGSCIIILLVICRAMHCSCCRTVPADFPLRRSPSSASSRGQTNDRVLDALLPKERTTGATFSGPRRSNRQIVRLLLVFQFSNRGPCVHEPIAMAGTCGHVTVLPFQTVQWLTKGPRRVYSHSRMDTAYKLSLPSPTYRPPTFRDVCRDRSP
jgi:hypothetical protein